MMMFDGYKFVDDPMGKLKKSRGSCPGFDLMIRSTIQRFNQVILPNKPNIDPTEL